LKLVLSRSTGIDPVAAPPFRPDVGGVHARAGPVDPASRVKFGQQRLVELVEHPGLGQSPVTPPARHSRSRTRLPGQVFPPDAGVEHEQHLLQHQPIRQRLRALPTRRPGRQQQLDPGPQLVGHHLGRSHHKIISEQDHRCLGLLEHPRPDVPVAIPLSCRDQDGRRTIASPYPWPRGRH
jgi:hypothetical protein